MLNQEIKTERSFSQAPSRWDYLNSGLESSNFQNVNSALCKIRENITQELLEEDPYSVQQAVEIAVRRGIEHPNYTVQIAGIGVIGEVIETIVENEHPFRYLRTFDYASDVLQIVKDNEEGRYREIVQRMAGDRIPKVIEKI
jgi:hypothetical protein